MSDAASDSRGMSGSRRRWLTVLGILVLVAGAIYGLYWLLYARFYVSTDDAYVGGDIVSVTSREAGTVLSLHADNTQRVREGELLAELDPTKAEVALDEAEADLARTVRSVRTDFAKVDQAKAQLASSRTALVQAEADRKRRQSAGNAVSAEELAHARDAAAAAKDQVHASQSALAEAEAAVAGASVARNPDVLAAEARLRDAAIVRAHMRIIAPVSGVVAQRTAQLGEQIAAGAALMAIVPLDDVWIDANFKENQLRDMRVGQPATVTADLYGGNVVYHGRIVGLGAGSGSAFALLPPQNASGNWIKIVQRVPVRIALDPRELRDHPLRVGLSASVSVDISDTSGSALGSPAQFRRMESAPPDEGMRAANTLIARVLAENGGR